MNCPQCGKPSLPAQKFCARCGAPLNIATTSTQHDPSQPLQAPGPQLHGADSIYPQQDPQPVYNSPPAPNRNSLALILTLGAGLLLLAIIAVTVILITRPGTSDISSREPETALKQAIAAMSNVKTFHYSSEVGFFGIDTGATGITDTVPLTITLSGDVSLPSSFTLDANIPQLGHYIGIGDNTWKRQSGGDPWTQQSTGESSLGLVNPLSFTSYLSYYMTGTVQTINFGKQSDDYTQRIRFKVDAPRMANTTTDSGISQILATTRAINMDVWLDKDNYIKRMTLSVDMQSGAGVILRTTFSNYNGTVNIKPPQ